MRAVVLVGGEGTRLRPLTLTTPKQLLPIANVPMIERVVAHLVAHGVDDVVLSMGYRPDAFLHRYPDGRCGGAALHYAVEPEPLDTGGAIGFAARHARVDDTFVVVNGDVITDLDVSGLIAFHRRSGARGTIALTPVDDPSRFGVVPIDEKGRVTTFIEKPPPGTAPTNLINAGTYVLEPDVIDSIPEGRRVSVERETFPSLVDDGSLYAVASDAYWIDAGVPATYLTANLDLVGDEGMVGPGSDVAPEATIIRSAVGSECRLGNGAVVQRSVLLPGVRVGEGARVVGSLLGRDAVVGAGASVGDLSVIGDGVEIPAAAEVVGALVPTPAGQ